MLDWIHFALKFTKLIYLEHCTLQNCRISELEEDLMQNLMKMEIWVFVLGQVNESVASSCQIYPFNTEEEIFHLNIYPLQ